MSNNLFKTVKKVELDNNFYLESDGGWGISLVQHYPAKRKNKEGVETDYTATERYYYTNVAQALVKYINLKQIILPSVVEMLEIQKQVLYVLEDFKKKYKNW